jgi:DNA primase
MQKINVLSFKHLKQRISIEQVLRHYNLFEGLQPRGKSHRGYCPFCEVQEGAPFSVSLEKRCFQCFACQASGNILDFVAKWEGVSIREAGQILSKHFVGEEELHTVAKTEEKTVAREVPPAEEAGPPAPAPPARFAESRRAGVDEAGKRADKASSTQAPTATPPQGGISSRNEPLTFALKNIEPDHPSVKALEIHEDILTAFGVGYYRGRGMMENHIVIPIYNPNRQLVAYAGFHPEDRTYTYPPKFRREFELYNLGGARAADGEDRGLILVRHLLEALVLISAGHFNAVAIMGEIISEEQVEALLSEHGAGEKMTLFWPTQTDVVPTLSELFPHFFVRLRRYEYRENTPSGFTADDVRELLA